MASTRYASKRPVSFDLYDFVALALNLLSLGALDFGMIVEGHCHCWWPGCRAGDEPDSVADPVCVDRQG
jgi:hypothetical protein